MTDLTRLHNLAENLRKRSVPARNARSDKAWYRIVNQVDVTEVYVYDYIGEWGVTAADFVGELKNITTPKIDLHINCEGGEVFDGVAIYESIRQHPSHVTAYVDSLAASAASFIVQAADDRVMARNARMMIHDAQGLAIGNAADMREMAGLLDDLSSNIADIYAERSGHTVKHWRDQMNAANGSGTWYSAQDAVDAGLADSVKAASSTTSSTSENKTAPPAAQVLTAQAPLTQANAWDPQKFLQAVQEAVA